MMKKILIAIIYCFFLTSISYGTFNMSALDTGYIGSIDSTNLTQIYSVINYRLIYNKYIRDHGTEPTEQRYRGYTPNVAVSNYYESRNQKGVRQYIKALKRQDMGKVGKILDYSRNSGNNQLLRFNGSNIKPMIIGSGVLGFQPNLYGKGIWFYHFIQDNKYYIISSKPLTSYTDTTISYFNNSGDVVLNDSLVVYDNSSNTESQIVTDVDNVINGTGVDDKKYKIIKQSFDDFVKQINTGGK